MFTNALLLAALGGGQVEGPSALVVTLQEVGWDDLVGQDTPAIAALSAAGMTFEQSYGSPNAAATQARVLTGLRAHYNGVGSAPSNVNPGLELSVDTLAELWDGPSGFFGDWLVGGDPVSQGFAVAGSVADALGFVAGADSQSLAVVSLPAGPLESVDAQLGQLLAVVPADWYVLLVSISAAPGPKAGGTPYQGGVRLPMIVSGPGIAGGVVLKGWTEANDVAPTLNELMEWGAVDPEDSVSFAGVLGGSALSSRPYVFASSFDLNGQPGDSREYVQVILQGQNKLIRWLREGTAYHEERYFLAITGETVPLSTSWSSATYFQLMQFLWEVRTGFPWYPGAN